MLKNSKKLNRLKSRSFMRFLEDPEDIQEKLIAKAYVHHDHGGKEHGHDWDDELRDEREVEQAHERKLRFRHFRRRKNKVLMKG